MKIAHVTPTFPPDKGGMGNAAYHMAIETAKFQNKIVVFTPQYKRVNEVSYNDIQVIRIKPVIKYGKAAFIPQIFLKLSSFMIIHLHYPFFGGAEVVWFLKKCKPDLKLVISYHMDVVGKGLRAAIYKMYTKTYLPKIVSLADKIIISSYDYFNHSYIKGIAKEEKVEEIPFGVNENLSPQKKDNHLLKKWGIAPDEQVILFVGGLEYFKGVEFLIKSIPHLKGKIKLLIAGEGPLMNEYRELAKNLGIIRQVCFTGSVSDEELVKYYNLADLLILPSIDRSEAFGIVLIEAMACGKPVIASNLPGVRTVVDDGINGFLTTPGNVADIAKKLQLLLNNEGLRRKFGQKGREKVLKKYRWSKVGYKLDSLYKQLAKKNLSQVKTRT